ncbi:UDP-N-acetylmuramoyl-L-alanyl-D-glutamate--2,6-diaminopimelate ligase [Luteimonas sp. SJ-92]|uniref:UDP-N-acetylmuramoyl-L-alanyl-D-glutamate--2,6-diaminopimelate ligase n=1 Tax=Luteimonas salinisoli TaxID=2752307 RepID=A0A853JIL0_9GAMM|nr:UDP-N-acetylmuramoyl-L-alanyl-D-glutamate--2,6-diaminopimelate ligase [Luteimonas salinisoli]NZA28377.1 UDP-N-acetylmuramoyl-L-alanyl-D-glutamate--2,6-diaminopimelate ligase [Luteimonas salinisoli]
MSAAIALADLLPDVPGAPPGLRIAGLSQDSRALRAGEAFVALPGFGTHGLRFAAQARAAGASAVLFEPPAPADVQVPGDAIAVPGLRARLGAMADRLHGAPSAAMATVGVTGTNGKTSTVQLLAQAWTLRGLRAGSIGTLGAGLHGQVEATGFTTPQVSQMHALLARLRDAGAEAVAMEVSSHALDQGRVDGVHFRVAVFTNLTRDHLDYHGDMDTYGGAKARLFAWPGLQAAVLNLDDAFGRALYARLDGSLPVRADGSGPAVPLAAGEADRLHVSGTRSDAASTGAEDERPRAIGISARGEAAAAVRATGLILDGDGIAFDLHIGDAVHAVRSPLLGRFNVDNLLAVAGTLHALGDAPAAIAAALSRLLPVAGRMNRLGGNGQPVVVIDYAHTPDALEQALSSLRAHARGRVVCVFGCGGERDRGKRPQMAAIAEAGADAVIVTDDNPRREDGDAIVADVLAGFVDRAAVAVLRDRRRAIARAIGGAGPGDIVLVAGKGHEPYQEIDGVRHPFDDTEAAAAALAGRA